MASESFKLSAALYGHSLDVRSLSVTQDNYIVSGSRDKTAKLWKPNEINTGYSNNLTYKGHLNFVSSVCVLKPSEKFPTGVVITGGNDNIICAYDLNEPKPFATYKEHSNTVCNLSEGIEPETFLSSSWDCTSKFWNVSILTSFVTYKGHEAAVWASIQLSNSNVVTGSADKNIIIWNKDGTKIKVLKEHTDCVRDLAALNNDIFLSVSNDSSIKQWTNNGDCLNTFYGHTNYIYGVCINKVVPNSFVTCGEDKTFRYWLDGENISTVTLPAQSVWSVACLNNGDIVTGSSDGIVRIFTLNSKRVADEQALKTFKEEVNALVEADTQEIGGVKIKDLPGREVLYEPGKSDGQTKLIREGAQVICYSWSATKNEWEKVGDVLGASGGTQETSGKNLYEGKEYDFVFSVDIEDGKPPIKLPYNKTEDPWFAAQQFIHKNNLPQVYLEQVANFIITNSNQQNGPIATNNTPGYVDPFTGGSRYVPVLSDVGSTNGVSGLDPFTGSNSYRTQKSEPMETSSTKSNPASYIPQMNYLRFDQSNIDGICQKLKEFNNKILNDESLKDHYFTFDEKILNEIVALATKGEMKYSVVDYLLNLLKWPKELVFPGLDLTRLSVRHANVNAKLCTEQNNFILLTLETYTNSNIPANVMLSYRILSNLFSHSIGEKFMLENKSRFIEILKNVKSSVFNKNVQIATSTLMLNWCIAFTRNKDYDGMETIIEIFQYLFSIVNDMEAIFRLLVGLGTLVHEADASIKLRIKCKIIANVDIKDKLLSYCVLESDSDNASKVVSCALQVYEIIQ